MSRAHLSQKTRQKTLHISHGSPIRRMRRIRRQSYLDQSQMSQIIRRTHVLLSLTHFSTKTWVALPGTLING